ncbi:MAG: hypothetical protein DKINENOH_04998 [bacterium]|nr:hypothetical protein [bacterium]
MTCAGGLPAAQANAAATGWTMEVVASTYDDSF